MLDLSISLVQTSIVWEDKQANLDHFTRILKSIPSTHLVVIPEMFNTGFSMNPSKNGETMDGITINWMKQIANSHQFELAASLIIEEDGKYYNRFVKVSPSGNIESYDKRHAFSMAGEDKVFTKGNSRVIWNTQGWRICPQVCYDLRFPVWSRNDSNYDLLLYTANWPTKRINHWLALAKARAIENQCYVAAVNRIGTDGEGIDYNGNSVVCDYDGESLAHNVGDNIILTTTLSFSNLQERRKQFGVLKDKDAFNITESTS